MRVILSHQLLTPVGFELRGMSLCDIRCLADSISTITGLANEAAAPEAPRSHPAAVRFPREHPSHFTPELSFGPNHPEVLNVCGTRLRVADSCKETTLGGAILVKGNYYGLTVKHVLYDDSPEAEPPEPKAENIRIYDTDWAEEDSSDTDWECDVQDGNLIGEEDELAHSPGTDLFLVDRNNQKDGAVSVVPRVCL